MRASLVTLPLALLVACGGAATPAATPAGSREHHEHHPHQHHGGHHRFENAEAWAKVFDDPARDAWQRPDEVVALLALQPGMTVADLGAGTGYFEARLSAAVGPGGRVLALDVEADMVRYMKERATREALQNVEPRQVASDDPGLEPASVDRVLVVDTWHHVADRPAYAAKLAAALEPGGFVMIVDFTQESALGPPVAMRVRQEEVVADLQAGGLTAEVVAGETLPEQFVVIGKR
jgi:ubiquinone/menaquinone biosynthesis C-methylase UbiE